MKHPLRTLALILFCLLVVGTLYTAVNVRVNQNNVVDVSKRRGGEVVAEVGTCNMCNVNRRYVI